jgi:hypothetical protein
VRLAVLFVDDGGVVGADNALLAEVADRVEVSGASSTLS